MRSTGHIEHQKPDRAMPRPRSARSRGALLLSGSLVLSFACTAFGGEADHTDGAALFRQHCSACHRDALGRRPAEEIVSIIRTPPSPMPSFDEEKLPDRDARAIAEYIQHPDRVPAGARAEPEPHSVPPAVPAVPVPPAPPEPRAAAPAPAKAARPRPAAEKRPEKKRTPVRSFVRTWTIKGLRNNEVVTFQKLQITEKGKDELTIIPALQLSDYIVTVTSFEVIDRTLRLQLSWTWKNSSSYWKTETYELSLSEDGKRLTGSYTVRAAGGQNAAASVWGE